MNLLFKLSIGLLLILTGCTSSDKQDSDKTNNEQNETKNTSMNETDPNAMPLGAFSLSLEVQDLEASKAFYESLGFEVLAGSFEINYFIMKNGNALIGIFKGHFKGQILTFNPGWDESAQNTETFTDVRDIQKSLKTDGVALDLEADESTQGPGSIMLKDPDGNVILIDQHR